MKQPKRNVPQKTRASSAPSNADAKDDATVDSEAADSGAGVATHSDDIPEDLSDEALQKLSKSERRRLRKLKRRQRAA